MENHTTTSRQEKKIIIHYWPTKGIVQPILYLMQYLEVPFEWKKVVNSEEYYRSKPLLVQEGLFLPNLPYIEDGQIKLSESYSIMAYLAKRESRADILPNVVTFGKVLEMKNIVSNLSQGFNQINFSSKSVKQMKDLYQSYLKKNESILQSIQDILSHQTWLISKNINIVDFKFAYFLEKLLRFEKEKGISEISKKIELTQYWNQFSRLPVVRDYIKKTQGTLNYYSSDATWGASEHQ